DDVMPHRVVDELEAVEIEEQHRERAVLTRARAPGRVGETLHEVRPVWQPGQRIVLRVAPQLLLTLIAIDDLGAQLQFRRRDLPNVDEERELGLGPLAWLIVERADDPPQNPIG